MNFAGRKTGDELESRELVWEVSEKPWMRGDHGAAVGSWRSVPETLRKSGTSLEGSSLLTLKP